MVERLPLDFVRKIYAVLTTGNEDVNFYCMCAQNQDREKATNSPILFAINLIKINIMCRLPFVKKKNFSEIIGEDYLSKSFVRPAISELASGMLDNSYIITDIFGSAITTVISIKDIFNEMETELGIKGFAKIRMKFSNNLLTLQEIYSKINQKLHTSIDYKFELMIMEKYFIDNRYIIRLFDIADYNNVNVIAIIPTSYPKNYIVKLLNQFGIHTDNLIITSEMKEYNFSSIIENGKYTGIISSEYKNYIKKFLKYGCKPIYYRNPKMLMKRTIHPEIDDKFKNIYDGICGLRLFSGIKRMSRSYEVAYLCFAPAIFGFAQSIIEKSQKSEKIICLCEQKSIFASILTKLNKNNIPITFISWSPLATDKYKTVSQWSQIINEMPIFCDAYRGVFDRFLRYPIQTQQDNLSTNFIAKVMATGWKAKTSNGVKSYIINSIGNSKNVVIADPFEGKESSISYCKVISKLMPDVVYKCITTSEFFGDKVNEQHTLSRIIQGDNPILCQLQNDEKLWVYQRKITPNVLNEIYKAIQNFTDDFLTYCEQSENKVTISGKDSFLLYDKGSKIINKKLFGDEV